jgi:hypothetical protein
MNFSEEEYNYDDQILVLDMVCKPYNYKVIKVNQSSPKVMNIY